MKLITVGNFSKVKEQKEFIEVFEDFDDSIQCFVGKRKELLIIHGIKHEEMWEKILKEFHWMGYLLKSTSEQSLWIE